VRAVFASRNPHKLEQARLLLPDVELIQLDEAAAGLVLEEPFDTLEANALAKARTVVTATGEPAIADDSGLEVDALDGRPGVHSARYAGVGATDDDNNRKLVAELSGVPEELLTCRYRCVAVFVSPEGDEEVAEGVCLGRVVVAGRGSLGFGYDPHVVPEGETRTMGEIPLEEKLRFSHRGRAFRALRERLMARAEPPGASSVIERLDRGHADIALAESDMSESPFDQFEMWLNEALQADLILPNAMTLATATADAKPSARMVLLKSFDDHGFVFFTSYDSRKGRELAANPYAALVFHWAELERQVRAAGTVAPVSPAESERYWRTRPEATKLGAWASRQSEVIANRAVLDDRLRAATARYGGADVPLPPYWGGYRLRPEEIEFWQGRLDRLHDRLLYSRAGTGWVVRRLSP
jgi:pyridoxamine 5'-phosphate oxidase